MIKLLPNPKFLKWLLAAIAKARKEIVIVNYLATLREGDRKGPVARVVAALKRAMKRGVAVTVILEGRKLSENYAFYRALKGAGADAWMDTSLTFIHEKAVLIDGRRLAVGSQNITYSALTTHEELALVVGDRRAVAAFGRELARITAQRREIGDASREGVRLPASVVDALTRIKRSLAKHPYLVYLLLCRLDGGRPKRLDVDPAWIEELGLSKSAASDSRRLREALTYLDERLGLVKYDRKRGRVKRKALPRSSHTILLPGAFWKYGWHARLSVEAIHLYFAGEAERIESPFAPWWRKKRDEIAGRWGFQKQLVNRAQQELMRYDLVEILYETASSAYRRYIRYSNLFRQDPFYDYDARMAKIARLAKRRPAAVFKQATSIAAAVCRDSDAEGLAALCTRIRAAGPAPARRALRKIRALAPNSTRRTLAYALELLMDVTRNS